MEDALKTMLPLLAFMLIPVWIPMIAVAAGATYDAVGRLRGVSRVTVSADAIKARAQAQAQSQPA